ncbi:hypothetical protein HSBAA_62540 [Vreelandella sulfidaeris]|uniref:Uncharacterized protein n=1 Tax=Vreelandella sulfidaeris TaxID=115553 RepID=A0A455UKS2_9GAMM|nr:hypothetical protein HSBAA_62540 [Halomonas sulfidaeris]
MRAFNRALGETLKDPEAAIEYVRERDSLIDVEIETRRLKLALDSVVDTPDAREYGVGVLMKSACARPSSWLPMPMTCRRCRRLTKCSILATCRRAVNANC